MSISAQPHRIWLCADDYGMSPGVNRSICELIRAGRLNATSVMVVGQSITAQDVSELQEAVAQNPGCAVGLHLTLTSPFSALTMHYQPLHDGLFPSLGSLLGLAALRRLDKSIIASEITAQIVAFRKLFGRAPDYVDGHQHAHIFPQIRDAFLNAVQQHAPDAWVRQCGRTSGKGGLSLSKSALLDYLSAGFRKRAARRNIAFNPDFDGAYDFTKAPDFSALMRGFLTGLPPGALVMCHPGYVDDVLRGLDPLTHQRKAEHDYLASDAFPALLREMNVTLA